MRRWALTVIAVATLCRLGIAAFLPAGVDEAYSLGIAREFSLSYFDHPPLHLWLVGLWAKLWGSEELLLVRLPFVALGALSSWLIYLLGERLFGPVAGLWSVLIFTLAPVFGLVHTTLILPDGPLLAASLATALAVAGIVFSPARGPRFALWAAAGLAAGLALLSKYHGVLLVLGVFLFLLTTREGRRRLATPGPWLAAVIAVACFAPVLIWNSQHDWASFAFQTGRGHYGTGIQLTGPLQSLVLQSVFLLPWIAAPLAVFLIRGVVAGPSDPRRWLLVCLASLPVILFTALTLLGDGLAHWPMPGWLFAIPLLAQALAEGGRLMKRVAGTTAALTTALLVAIGGVATAQARWGTFDAPLTALLGNDPTKDLVSWDQLKPILEARGLPADRQTFIGSFNWIRSGQLNALFGKDIPVICICGGDPRHFAYLNPPADYAGWTAVLIGVPRVIENDEELAKQFGSLGPVEDVSLTKSGRVMLRLAMRIASDFKP